MHNVQQKRKKKPKRQETKKNTNSRTHILTLQLFLGARLNLKHAHKRRCWSALYAISTRQYAIKCTVHTTYMHWHWHQWRNKHVNTQCVCTVYSMCAFHKRKSSAVCCFYFRFILVFELLDATNRYDEWWWFEILRSLWKSIWSRNLW